MSDRATMRRQPVSRIPDRANRRRETQEAPVFLPPADAPVLQGTTAPVRVVTGEHHDPKAYS